MANKSSLSRMLGTIIVTVFAGELAVMTAFQYLPMQLSGMQVVFWDAFLLSIICSPVLWLVVARPLKATAMAATQKFDRLLETSPDGMVGVNERGDGKPKISGPVKLLGFSVVD